MHAETGGHRLVEKGRHPGFDRGPQAAGRRYPHFRIIAGDVDTEFFATDPGDEVDGTKLKLGDPCHAHQHLVACGVTIAVIDPFEMIEIEHDHQHRLSQSGGPLHKSMVSFLEPAAVPQPRQGGAIGLALEVQHDLFPLLHQGHDHLGHTADRIHALDFQGRGLAIEAVALHGVDDPIYRTKKEANG